MIRSLLCLPFALVVQGQEPPPPKPAVPLPAVLALPPELEVKPGSLTSHDFDRESFDLHPAPGKASVAVPVAGRTWRMALKAAGPRPLGAFAMLGRLLPALEQAGWILEWPDRGIAKRTEGERQYWLKAAAGASGELRVVLVEKGAPRMLDLPLPGLKSELPKGTEDFPYLPPWPGAKLTASNVSQAPVDLKLADGSERIQMVNFLEKEYSLPKPPSDHEFLVVYREALERAGWVLEGTLRGVVTQVQATYNRRGRDLRATLRLMGDAMAISVADVGAQLPPFPSNPPDPPRPR